MRLLPGIAVLALACSGSSTRHQEQIRSELRQLRSLSAETELFHDMIARGQLPKRFVAGHAHYLEEAAAEHAKKLGAAPR